MPPERSAGPADRLEVPDWKSQHDFFFYFQLWLCVCAYERDISITMDEEQSYASLKQEMGEQVLGKNEIFLPGISTGNSKFLTFFGLWP